MSRTGLFGLAICVAGPIAAVGLLAGGVHAQQACCYPTINPLTSCPAMVGAMEGARCDCAGVAGTVAFCADAARSRRPDAAIGTDALLDQLQINDQDAGIGGPSEDQRQDPEAPLE